MREVSRFAIGDVLKTSLSTYGRNLPTAVVLTAIAFAPACAVFAWVFGGGIDIDSPDQPLGLWLVSYGLAILFGTFFLEAGMTFAVVRSLRTTPPGLGEVLAFALRALPRVLVVGILVILLVGLGMFALIVPGVILLLVFWVTVPVAAVERVGAWRCLKRSHELTNGHKVPIFGIYFLIYFVVGVALELIAIPAMYLGLSETMFTQAIVVGFALARSVQAAMVAVCYHDLRVLKEGGDSGRIAEVFA